MGEPMQRDDEADGDFLPVVQLGPDQAACNDEVVEQLHRCEGLYQRMGRLVRVWEPAAGEFSNAPSIDLLTTGTLQEEITRVVDIQRYDKTQNEWVRTGPPSWMVAAVHDRKCWPGVPVLRGIVNFPVLRPDGSILQTPGYDPASKLVFRPSGEFLPVPETPTRQDDEEAKRALRDLVCQFPFVGEEDYSAYLAGVLTPFVRYAYEGGCPSFVVTANAPRVGKTKLVHIASLIYSGLPAPTSAYTRNEDELQNRIFGFAKNGDLLTLFDNVDCLFGNAILDAALTSQSWTGRQFHSQDSPPYPLKWILWVTSNRFRSKADTYKRIQPIKLKTLLEKPEKRSDLRDVRIERTVLNRRPELVRACLTLLRSYFANCTDEVDIPYWHTFPEWSEIVRKCLVWHGLKDPYIAHEANTEDIDTTVSAKRTLVLGWKELLDSEKLSSCSTRDAHRLMAEALEEYENSPGTGLRLETLISALQDRQIAPNRRGALPDPGEIGYILRSIQDSIFDGYAIAAKDKGRSGTLWTVEKVEE